MKILSLLVILTGLVGCRTPQQRSEVKLIGGKVASEVFPATFMLRSSCTATKIADNLIMTAAHCVVSKEYMDLKPQYKAKHGIPLKIRPGLSHEGQAGVTDLKLKLVRTLVFGPYMAECEEKCDSPRALPLLSPSPHDVAILEVEPTAEFGALGKVDLARSAPHTDTDLTLLGYGCEEGAHVPRDPSYRLKTKVARKLDEQDVKQTALIDEDVLPHIVRNYIQTPGQYFVRDGQKMMDQTASLCPGDSGGPLYTQEDGKWVVVGINSLVNVTKEDQKGISVLNHHARVDAQSSRDVYLWAAKLKGEDVPGAEPVAEPVEPAEGEKRAKGEVFGERKIEGKRIDREDQELSFEAVKVPFGRWAFITNADFHTSIEAYVLRNGQEIKLQVQTRRKFEGTKKVTYHDANLLFDEPETVRVRLKAYSGETGPLDIRIEGSGCRFCHLVFDMNRVFMGPDGDPLSEAEIARKIHGILKGAGINSWIFANSVELSRDKLWVNVKLQPGGTATEAFDDRHQQEDRAYWYVAKGNLQKAFADQGVMLKSVSSYVNFLGRFQ